MPPRKKVENKDPETSTPESKETETQEIVSKQKQKRTARAVRPSKPQNYTQGEECIICASEYTLKNLKTICSFCKFEVCRSCVQTNIKTQSTEPRCLSDKCSHLYGDSWLRENLNITFIREDIKEIRKKFVFDRETALLPATMEFAENIRREEKRRHLNLIISNTLGFYSSQMNEINERISLINSMQTDIKTIPKLKELPNKDKYKEALNSALTKWGKLQYLLTNKLILEIPTELPTDEEIKEIKQKIDLEYPQIRERHKTEHKRLTDEVAGLYANARGINRSGTIKPDEKQETKVFSRPCPVGDCRGYVSPMPGNHSLECGLCKSQLCIKCHVQTKGENMDVKDEKHECKPDDIATVKELKDSTKPCPKCSALIFKISGCDVMFCTACNTAFSWNSGTILDARRVHNPHLMAFLNRGGNVNIPNQQMDVYGCDTGNILRGYLRKLETKDPKNTNAIKIRQIVNSASVLQGEIQSISYRNTRQRVDRMLRELRVQYLLGNIDKKRLQSDALKIEKEYNIQEEVSGVYDMFARGIVQICNVITTEALTAGLAETIIKQVEELIVFYHDGVDAILDRFDSKRKLHRINSDWGITGHH